MLFRSFRDYNETQIGTHLAQPVREMVREFLVTTLQFGLQFRELAPRPLIAVACDARQFINRISCSSKHHRRLNPDTSVDQCRNIGSRLHRIMQAAMINARK